MLVAMQDQLGALLGDHPLEIGGVGEALVNWPNVGQRRVMQQDHAKQPKVANRGQAGCESL